MRETLGPFLLILLAGVVGGALAIASGLLLFVDVGSILRGERDLGGYPVYSPRHPVELTAVEGLDFRAIHGDLFTSWILEIDHDGGTESGNAIRRALAVTPNLLTLFDEMDALARSDPGENADRLLYLSWAWNERLQQLGVPWRVDAVVRGTARRSTFYVKTYHVLSDLSVRVGESTQRVRLLERADALGVTESYLGNTTRFASDGALVLVDRTREFALDDVWPLLGTDPSDPRRTYRAAIQREIAELVPPEHRRVLTESAPLRARLVALLDTIRERRECGSKLSILPLPWDGLDDDAEQRLSALARDSRGLHCPPIIEAEVDLLREASVALRETDGLEPALEALIAATTRPVAVHEARHVADDPRRDGDVDCAECPHSLDAGGRSELSAYLASFAHPNVSALSMLQACELLDSVSTHGDALRELESLFPDGCRVLPGDVSSKARALEYHWFGRSEDIELPPSYPKRLPLTEQRRLR